MDNQSAFNACQYDESIRKVIPFYDTIYEQIFSLIQTYGGGRPLSLLDTGCGTGTLGRMACESLTLSELVLCDPSDRMLREAQRKLHGCSCEFICTGSENLRFVDRFDVVTAIQSHHYFDRPTREAAVHACYRALKPGGLFICFENTAPFSAIGKELMLGRLEAYERRAGRSSAEIQAHSARYNREFFPLTITEHRELLLHVGFSAAELFWHSYMQSGFYAVK